MDRGKEERKQRDGYVEGKEETEQNVEEVGMPISAKGGGLRRGLSAMPSIISK